MGNWGVGKTSLMQIKQEGDTLEVVYFGRTIGDKVFEEQYSVTFVNDDLIEISGTDHRGKTRLHEAFLDPSDPANRMIVTSWSSFTRVSDDEAKHRLSILRK